MRIYIDDREDDDRILFLKKDQFFRQMTVKRLEVGDILIERDDHEDIVIEIKTLQDWTNSMNNKQLEKEANQMKEYNVRGIIVYDDGKLNTWYTKLPGTARNYMKHAELEYRWHLPVFFCENVNKMTEAIKAIIKTVNKEYEPLPYPIVVKTNKDEMKAVLLNIDGIGDKMADKLLDKFGTPGGVFKASTEELNSVKRLQEKAKKAIKRMR